MSTVQTWTLWQRMPPRYQLTTKSMLDDPDELVAIGNSAERVITPRKSSSPRPYSAGPKSPRQTLSASERENFMLSSSVPESVQNEVKESVKGSQPKGFSFPKRNSDYINTFQKQRKVNSARRRLAEAPPIPNQSSTQPSDAPVAQRAKTAPVFPVTSPDAHKGRRSKLSDSSNLQEAVTCKNVTNLKSKSVSDTSKVDMFQFEDMKSVSSSSGSVQQKTQELEPKAKKYVVQDTNKATVYIDNGKVMYFGKSRHDLTQLLKTQSLRADRNSCFLAEIRRDYLKHPKYDREHGPTVKKTENDPRRIAHERVDYNRRVEHILSYYDENHPESRMSHFRPASGSRVKSPRGGRIKGLSLTPATIPPPSPSPSPEPVDPLPNDYIRLNKQSKLHERQFYLRTPGLQHASNVSELERCRCSMCRMELQLALVTGSSQDAGLAIVAAANDARNAGKTLGKFSTVKYSRDDGGKIPRDFSLHRKAVVRSNSQKVSFKKENEEPVKSETNKVRINCKLPEVTDMAVSESGFESSRTQDATSPFTEDVTESST